MTQVKTIIQDLTENHNPNEHLMISSWTVGDIQGQADDIGVELSDDEAVEVMEYIGGRMDACVGINWDVITKAIQDLFLNKDPDQ
jgi:hypothetical protein